MAKTLTQLNAQIAKFQKEAQTLMAKEVDGVVERIKVAIRHYGLTAADLGFPGRTTKAMKVVEKGAAKKTRKTGVGDRLAWRLTSVVDCWLRMTSAISSGV